MGAKLTTVDKRMAPGAGTYEIPSKLIEKQGKSMGQKLESGLVKRNSAAEPGPNAY
jgi:hypothetical protein